MAKSIDSNARPATDGGDLVREIDVRADWCERDAVGFDQRLHQRMGRQRDIVTGPRQPLGQGHKRLNVAA